MPDISMCASEKCPQRFTCYRHSESGTVPSEHRQAWGPFAWRGFCPYYVPTAEKMEAGQ